MTATFTGRLPRPPSCPSCQPSQCEKNAAMGDLLACNRWRLRRRHMIKGAEICWAMQAAIRADQPLSCDEATAITGVSPPPPGTVG
jgi:hypothetical protein